MRVIIVPSVMTPMYELSSYTWIVVVLLTSSIMTNRALPGNVSSRSDVINGAKCRVRCLALLQSKMEDELPTKITDSMTLITCLQDEECEACLRPCSQPFLAVHLCEEVCKTPKSSEYCRDSCRFLERVNNIRPGTCPPETRATGEAARCIDGCKNDADCDDPLKCCSNSCGWTCQEPTHKEDGMPDIPARPVLKERTKGGSVEVKWNSVLPNTTGPVLYIVDSRWNVGKTYNEVDMTPWQQVAQVTGTSAVISDITPGHWYQFRVMAVNIYGSRGGSLPTEAFTLTKEPKRPGPPLNLTEGDTIITGRKVAVTIRWFPPNKSDLPITRYKIHWRRKAGNSVSMDDSKEFRQIIPGDRLFFQIPNLDLDSTYFVQVQAICQYGDVKLKSERASLVIATFPFPKVTAQMKDMGVENTLVVDSFPTPPTPTSLISGSPYFYNGSLLANVSWTLPKVLPSDPVIDKVLVNWSPEACISDGMPDDNLAKTMSSFTQDNRFTINNLRFDCRYIVRVQPFSRQGTTGDKVYVSLTTPSCSHVIVIGHVKPDCPNIMLPKIPRQPRNLRHSFLINSSNITARVMWDEPLPHDNTLTGYRVIWGELLQSHGADKASTFTKVLPNEIKSYNIGGLQEATTYSIKVQALAKDVVGAAAVIQFTTPLLQAPPIGPPYHQVEDLHFDDSNAFRDRPKEAAIIATTNPLLITILQSDMDNLERRWNSHSTATSSSCCLLFLPVVLRCLTLHL